jgi:hypothetical protein
MALSRFAGTGTLFLGERRPTRISLDNGDLGPSSSRALLLRLTQNPKKNSSAPTPTVPNTAAIATFLFLGGSTDGDVLGNSDELMDGTNDGLAVGLLDGIKLGKSDGLRLGIPDGDVEGDFDGSDVGLSEGAKVGLSVGGEVNSKTTTSLTIVASKPASTKLCTINVLLDVVTLTPVLIQFLNHLSNV